MIAGNAFREDNNVEIAYAIKNGYKFKRYHEFLGHFMNQFTSFGVAGAHGKTSTTGLLSHSMKNITDTSYLIGDGTGRGSANAQYFVFEADEYERHFMPYHPAYSIITNIDFDHPDYFTSIDDVFSAFDDYAKQVQKGSLFTVRILTSVKLHPMHQSIIMDLKKMMTSWQQILFVQPRGLTSR